MKKILLTYLLLISTQLMAGLPPTSTKLSGESNFGTTFQTDYGALTGARSGTKITPNQTGSGAMVLGSNATVTNPTVTDDITLSGAQFNSIKIGEELARMMATGVAGGSLLTINGGDNTKWDLSQQTLTFSDQTTFTAPIVRKVICPALTAQTVTNLATQANTYILINSSCVVTQQSTFPTQAQRRSLAFIGRLSHPTNTVISTAVSLPDLVVDTNSQLYDLFDAIGAFNVSGNVISANGVNLSINKSAGSTFRRSANYATSNQNPNVVAISAQTPVTFLKATQTGINPTPTTTVDVANYDVGGVVTALSAAPAPTGLSTSANHRVYLFSNGTVAIQYGQVKYNNLANAVAGISSESFIVNPTAQDGGILLAIISCRRDATDLSDSAQCQITKMGRFDQTGAGAGSLATTTLQQAYSNSTTPQITTTTALGSVDFRRGSAADSDNVLRVQNGAGTTTWAVTGAGAVSALSATLTTPMAISSGGTGAATKAAAFDALSPMTTAGDIIIGGASGTGTRLATGSTSGHVLTSNGSGVAPSWQAVTGGVYLKYENLAGTTITTSNAIIPFATAVDSSAAFNGATGVFTCPSGGAGRYFVTSKLYLSGVTLSTSQLAQIAIFKNGTTATDVEVVAGVGSAGDRVYTLTVTGVVNLAVGDTIDIRARSDVADTLTTSTGFNNLSIVKIGF